MMDSAEGAHIADGSTRIGGKPRAGWCKSVMSAYVNDAVLVYTGWHLVRTCGYGSKQKEEELKCCMFEREVQALAAPLFANANAANGRVYMAVSVLHLKIKQNSFAKRAFWKSVFKSQCKLVRAVYSVLSLLG
eukprot:705457-Pleurochrysis_carterae.AAC.2